MLLPVPDELQAPVAALQRWALGHPEISAVFLFGSRVRGMHRPDSDLDVAVAFDLPDLEEADVFWIDHKARWEKELTQVIGLTIDLDEAHPKRAPKVWTYLRHQHTLVYVRGMELRQGRVISAT